MATTKRPVKKAAPARAASTRKAATPAKKRTLPRKKAATDGRTPNVRAANLQHLDDLASLVPDKAIHKAYIDRVIGGKNAMEVLAHAHANGMNVLIEGPTGCGKTMLAEAYAASISAPFYSISAHAGKTMDQIHGGWKPQPDGTYKFVYGPGAIMAKHGGVLLLNEVNFFSEKLVSGIFSLLDKRRTMTIDDNNGEVITASPNLLVIADMNPNYQGTRELNYAFKNRFPIKMSWDYDRLVEEKLVKSKALLDMAGAIRKRTKEDDYDTPTSTNMLIEFESVAVSLGLDFAVQNFVAAYSDEEQGSIKQLLDLHSPNIKRELWPPAPPKPGEGTGKRRSAKQAKDSLEGILDELDDFSFDVTCKKCGTQYDMAQSHCPTCNTKN
jgi:nitric oxide reductase NorQ protein